jgi:hypothetical protein
MIKKLILSALLLLGFTTTSSVANTKNNHLIQLASKQEKLSKNIMQSYTNNHSSTLKLIKEFESGQNTLKSTIRIPEIVNLLKYLNFCVDNLKKVVKEPYNRDNARLVADLSASLSEGNHYIAQTL